jgi:hypothetical protein
MNGAGATLGYVKLASAHGFTWHVDMPSRIDHRATCREDPYATGKHRFVGLRGAPNQPEELSARNRS